MTLFQGGIPELLNCLQETGQIHALKIFERRLKAVAERELVALRLLNHENIVAFIGQETDVST